MTSRQRTVLLRPVAIIAVYSLQVNRENRENREERRLDEQSYIGSAPRSLGCRFFEGVEQPPVERCFPLLAPESSSAQCIRKKGNETKRETEAGKVRGTRESFLGREMHARCDRVPRIGVTICKKKKLYA